MQIHYGPDDTNVDPPYFSPYDIFTLILYTYIPMNPCHLIFLWNNHRKLPDKSGLHMKRGKEGSW
jgi:hypothetical protein